jgi:hypothetical protein
MNEKTQGNKGKRKSISNYKRGDRPAEKHKEAEMLHREKKETVHSSNHGFPGEQGKPNHNYKVSQSNLVTTNWYT